MPKLFHFRLFPLNQPDILLSRKEFFAFSPNNDTFISYLTLMFPGNNQSILDRCRKFICCLGKPQTNFQIRKLNAISTQR